MDVKSGLIHGSNDIFPVVIVCLTVVIIDKLVPRYYPDSMQRFYRELGQRIRTARKRHAGGSLTQAELAERVDVSRSSIANIEQGRQQAPIHILVQIAEALGVSPGELLPRLEETDRATMVRALQNQNFGPETISEVTKLILLGETDDEQQS